MGEVAREEKRRKKRKKERQRCQVHTYGRGATISKNRTLALQRHGEKTRIERVDMLGNDGGWGL